MEEIEVMEIMTLRHLSLNEVYEWVTTCDEKFCPPRWNEERLSEHVLKLSQKAYFNLLIEKDIKVGFIAYYLNEEKKFAYITLIAVAHEFRGKGCSKILLDSFLTHISSDVEEVSLEVSKVNAPALGLYKKYGFVEIEDREEKVLMKKSL